jgi:hypothetical protein
MAFANDFVVKNGLVVSTTATIQSSVDASSTQSGALIVSGGAGLGGSLYVGGGAVVNSTLDVTCVGTGGALRVGGGVAVGNNLYVNSNTFIQNNLLINGKTSATSTLTGALVVAGGAAIQGDLWLSGVFHGALSASLNTATNLAGGTAGQVPWQSAPGATSFFGPGTTGSVLVSGGPLGPQYQNTLTLAGTTSSTNSTTGALIVAGGIGVGENVNAQGLFAASGFAEKPGSPYDIATSNFIHAGIGINIGAGTGGNLTFGDGYTPTVIQGTPTSLRVYLNNDQANNQLFAGSSDGLLIGNGGPAEATLDVRGSAVVTATIKINNDLATDDVVSSAIFKFDSKLQTVSSGPTGLYLTINNQNPTSRYDEKIYVNTWTFDTTLVKLPGVFELGNYGEGDMVLWGDGYRNEYLGLWFGGNQAGDATSGIFIGGQAPDEVNKGSQWQFTDNGELTLPNYAKIINNSVNGLSVGLRAGETTYAGNAGGITAVLWNGSNFLAFSQDNNSGNTILLSTADALSNWERNPISSNITTSSINVNKFIYNSPLYIAVGYSIEFGNPLIYTSTDTETWTEQTTPYSTSTVVKWNSVVVNPAGSLYVAVGSDVSSYVNVPKIITSPNGVTWTDRDPVVSAAWLSDIAASSSQYVVVGYNTDYTTATSIPVIITSPNGIAWTPHTGFSIPDRQVNPIAVAWSLELDQYVAVGYYYDAVNYGNDVPLIMTSSDGINWTQQFLPTDTITGRFTTITWISANNLWVASGNISGNGARNTLTANSTDGVNWNVDYPYATSKSVYINAHAHPNSIYGQLWVGSEEEYNWAASGGNESLALTLTSEYYGIGPSNSFTRVAYNLQGDDAVAIGSFAGQRNQGYESVALGRQAAQYNQGIESVAIGSNAGSGLPPVYVKYISGSDTTNITVSDTTDIVPGMHIDGQGSFVTVKTVVNGTDLILNNVAVSLYGVISFSQSQGDLAVAVGRNAGRYGQGTRAVAVGYGAGEGNQGFRSVALGQYAGNAAQGNYAVAIGYQAGYSGQVDNSVVISATGDIFAVSNTGTYIAPIRPDTTNEATQYSVYYNPATNEITTATASAVFNGGVVANTTTFLSTVTMASKTESVSTDSGGLITYGGVGVGGSLYVANNLVAGGVNLLAYDPTIHYVSDNIGVDNTATYTGHLPTAPFKTIKFALTQAQSGDTVYIEPGTYTETFPITIPQGVNIRGGGLRETYVQPTTATNTQSGFLLNGEVTISDLTIGGFYQPGYGLTFATGAKITTKSPYVERVSIITRGSVTSATDPYGFNQADAGSGVKLDAGVLDSTSLEPAMLFNELTLVVPNATGVYMTNGARAELLNGFVYFANKAINAVTGSTGYGGVGKTKLKLTASTGTFAVGDTLVYKDPTGTIITTGTISTVTSNSYVYLNGPVFGFDQVYDRTAKIATTYGTAALSTGQKKWGTASLAINADGAYVEVLSDVDFQFGTGDYTIEGYIYSTSVGATQYMWKKGTVSTSTVSAYMNTTGHIVVTHGATTITGSSILSANTWYHVRAVHRSSTTGLYLYVNGVSDGFDITATDNINNTDPFVIGENAGTSGTHWTGYLDDIRVSNVVRNTTDFTAPSSALASDSATVLMLHFNGTNLSTSIVDDPIATQNVYTTGASTATASRILLADYHQFGAELRSIGSAVVYGNTGVTANGTGTDLKLITFNMSHIGLGKDLSNDTSLAIQANEVIQINGGRIYYQTIDQDGDYRVGNSFLVNQRTGAVSFGSAQVNLANLNSLVITDGTNKATILPTSISVGDINLAGNTIASLSGNLTLDPAGALTTINSKAQVNGTLSVTGATSITNTTQSTSTNSGALTVTGGAGIGGNLYIGGNLSVAGVFLTAVNTASNLAGGLTGSIPYQTAPGQTAFIGIGSTGTLLQSNGTTATWLSTGSLSVGFSNTATNVANGLAGQLIYQTAPGITGFIATGTIGYVAVSKGINGIAYQNTLTLTGTTVSLSTDTGALTVAGGVGIGGDVYVGGTGFYLGNGGVGSRFSITDNSSLTAISRPNGSLTISGGGGSPGSGVPGLNASNNYSLTLHGGSTLGIILNAGTGLPVVVNQTVTATSTTTGALQVAGGVGIGGDLYVGGKIVAQQLTIEYTTITTTIVQTDDIIKTYNTTPTTSTGTGALVVAGGAGIGGGIYLGGAIIPDTNISYDLGSPTNRFRTLYVSSSTVDIGGITLSNVSSVLTLPATRITDTTVSTGTNTGALTVAGGVGIGGNIYGGGNLYVTTPGDATNAVYIGPTGNNGSSGQANLYLGNGTNTLSQAGIYFNYRSGVNSASMVYNNSTANLDIAVVPSNATITMSTPAGTAITVPANTQNVQFAGSATIASIVTSTNTTTGALIVAGGVGVGGRLNVGGTSTFIANLSNSSAVAGNTVQITGGLGVSSSIYANSVTIPAGASFTAGAGATFSYISLKLSNTSYGGGLSGFTDGIRTSQILFTNSDNGLFTATVAFNSLAGHKISGVSAGTSATYSTVATLQIAPTVISTSSATIINNLALLATGGIFINTSTAATSTSTGALQVTGGVGVGGDIYVGGQIYGAVTTATNLARGAAGAIPYQTAPGVTDFIGIGTTGYVLTSNGTTATWTAQSSGTPIADNTTTNATYYPVFATTTTGVLSSATISSSKLSWNPSTGQMTMVDINVTSDITAKTNVAGIAEPLDLLKQISGFSFNWRDTGAKSYGVIAQYIEQILPELVSNDAQGYKSVKYLPLIAILIESVKKLSDEVDELKKSGK